jgi:hypothetical protein
LTTLGFSTTGLSVDILWRTESERNNHGFEIERRSIGEQKVAMEWRPIGFVFGSGTTSSPRHYSFRDQPVFPGRYAYRVKQIDHNGSFVYTAEVEVEVGIAPKELVLSQNYPNPFNPVSSINFTLPKDGHVVLKLFDVAGREITTVLDEEKKGGYSYQATIDVSHLASGIYFCRLEFDGTLVIRKIAVAK